MCHLAADIHWFTTGNANTVHQNSRLSNVWRRQKKTKNTKIIFFTDKKIFFNVNKINYETFDKSHYRVRTCHYLTQVKFELIPVFPASHIVLLKTGRDYPAVKLFTSLRFVFPISSNICKTLLLISVFTNPQSSLLSHSLSKWIWRTFKVSGVETVKAKTLSVIWSLQQEQQHKKRINVQQSLNRRHFSIPQTATLWFKVWMSLVTHSAAVSATLQSFLPIT